MYEPLKCGLIVGILTGIIVYLTTFCNPAVIGLLATFPLSIIYLFFVDDEKEVPFVKMLLLGSIVYLSCIFVYYQMMGRGRKNSIVVSICFWILSVVVLYLLFIRD